MDAIISILSMGGVVFALAAVHPLLLVRVALGAAPAAATSAGNAARECDLSVALEQQQRMGVTSAAYLRERFVDNQTDPVALRNLRADPPEPRAVAGRPGRGVDDHGDRLRPAGVAAGAWGVSTCPPRPSGVVALQQAQSLWQSTFDSLTPALSAALPLDDLLWFLGLAPAIGT